MKREIKILDCTLRDGGYCNHWYFGKKNISKIGKALTIAMVDYLELGYLNDSAGSFDENRTIYACLSDLPIFPGVSNMIMMNFGDVDVAKLDNSKDKSCGIRLAFHKGDMMEALRDCEVLQSKGYDVFLQPMVTNSYDMDTFVNLVRETRRIKPKAFYIVDSFGSMHDTDIEKYAKILDVLMPSEVMIGFHGHDNLKMTLLNAITVVDICQNHDVCIDATIMGMGRGAGNLGTENIMEYAIRHWNGAYKINPILRVIDEVIGGFYEGNTWGYSLPYYLSACFNVHPNYARYFDAKKTLTNASMGELLKRLYDCGKQFNENYAEKKYIEYMESFSNREENMEELNSKIGGRTILLVAPGNSILEYRSQIIQYQEKNVPLVIGVNFEPEFIPVDYVFFSNQRRFLQWIEMHTYSEKKIILTSNIESKRKGFKVTYEKLLSQEEEISDNAGIMCIKFLISCGAKKIVLAGYDGYQIDDDLNYVSSDYHMFMSKTRKNAINRIISKKLEKFEKSIFIEFITPSIYRGN